MDYVLALARTGFVFGFIAFLIRFITCDLATAFGSKEIDNWHNPVSRWFPVPNDLFAMISLVVSTFCFFVLNLLR